MKTASYSIRVSTRAQRVRLKVTPTDGLCVVVPQGFDKRRVPALVAQKQRWIEKALLRVGSGERARPVVELPQHLRLPALGERWRITHKAEGKGTRLVVDKENQKLVIHAEHLRKKPAFACLKIWLKAHAKTTLTPQLVALAWEYGFKVNRVTIRNQVSRWGSCSADKNISLNMKLLFVTPEQLRYVLIHELCHTRQMHHQHSFWQLVERYEPDWDELRGSLEEAWNNIPAWV